MASLFDRITPATTQPSNPFLQAASSQPSNPFLSATTSTQPPNPFLSIKAPTQTSSVFGNQQQSQPQQSSLFGSSTQNQPQQLSVFGSSLQNQQPAPSLFGNTTQTQQPTNSLFSQPKPGLFGASTGQQQTQAQQQPQIGSILEQSQASRIWNENDLQPRQKSIPDQIQTITRKWDPSNLASPFKTYLYNTVPKDARPFYGPSQLDDEEKWEAALRSAPNDTSIPILVSGFQQLGSRITLQRSVLTVLQGRLHEINNGLTDLLRRHDLEIAPRAAECRRRHVRLAKKAMELASKTQVLRNRGYAMDAGEEALRVKLVDLERKVMDPGLGGRSEEIWARMVMLRDRGRILEAEVERLQGVAKAAAAGKQGEAADGGSGIDEEILKRAKKILEGYDSQITHLNKEMQEIRKELENWEAPKTGVNGRTR